MVVGRAVIRTVNEFSIMSAKGKESVDTMESVQQFYALRICGTNVNHDCESRTDNNNHFATFTLFTPNLVHEHLNSKEMVANSRETSRDLGCTQLMHNLIA